MGVIRALTSIIRKNSTGSDFQRRRVNLIEGSNVTLTVADDPTNNEIDVTIASSGGGGGSAYDNAVRVTRSTAQSISNATYTAITWDTETYDTDTMHSIVSNTERLTATTAGVYVISAAIGVANSATGSRAIRILKNETEVHRHYTAVQSADGWYWPLTIQLKLAATDYVTVEVYQSSGAALDLDHTVSSFAMAKVAVG
jgi:hypothetical protein